MICIPSSNAGPFVVCIYLCFSFLFYYFQAVLELLSNKKNCLRWWPLSDDWQRSREVKGMGELGRGPPPHQAEKGAPILFNTDTLEAALHFTGASPPSFWPAKWCTDYQLDRSFSNTNTHSSTGSLQPLPLPNNTFLLLGSLHSVMINTVRLRCTHYYNEPWQGRRRERSTVRTERRGRRDRMNRAEL